MKSPTILRMLSMFRKLRRGKVLPHVGQKRPKEVPLGYEGTERLREIESAGTWCGLNFVEICIIIQVVVAVKLPWNKAALRQKWK